MPVAAKMTTFAAGAAFGAGLAYFLDNQSGARRRNVARDKAQKYLRVGKGTAQDAAQAATAQAEAVRARAEHAVSGESAPPDDVTLTRKVETEIFRDADAPKGAVNVQAVDGVVELRGEVGDRTQIEALESKARAVTGVRDVRNLLHLPGETPSNVAGTPGAS